MLRVKIVCTIGPASREVDVLSKLIENGMNVARLNMSHGTHEYHLGTIERVRHLSAKLQKPVAILADLQGPKLRVGKMQAGGVPLVAGESLVLTNEAIVGVIGRVPVQYKKLPSLVTTGERILLDDGLLELEVVDKNENEIHTRVITNGVLHDNKGINLPDASLDIPALTPKDLEDVKFAVEQDADWIALSFVRTAAEVYELKAIIKDLRKDGLTTPVISKIEKPDAVKNIDAIIEASNAIMVARGDLGIETSAEAVPMIQKLIIAKCHMAVKPVITATQMLDSMIRNARPTRAEASDVANAVLDGTDAIMLSGETASGLYPVESVETMARIAREAENMRAESEMIQYKAPEIFTSAGAVCHATILTANEIGAAAIITPTISGNTAKLIAAFRPDAPVIAVTPIERVQRRLCLHWGIFPLLTEDIFATTDEVIADAVKVVKRHNLVKAGDRVVITGGVVGQGRGPTNLMIVRTIEDESSADAGNTEDVEAESEDIFRDPTEIAADEAMAQTAGSAALPLVQKQ